MKKSHRNVNLGDKTFITIIKRSQKCKFDRQKRHKNVNLGDKKS